MARTGSGCDTFAVPRRLLLTCLVGSLVFGGCKDGDEPSGDGAPAAADDGAGKGGDDGKSAADDGKAGDGGQAGDDGKAGDDGQTPPSTDPKTGPKKGGLAGIALGVVTDAKEAAKTPVNLLPPSVRIVIHVELEAVRELELYELVRNAMFKESDPDRDHAATLRRLQACNLDPDKATSFTMGVDDGDNAVAVIKGPGFGKFANFECLQTQLRTDGKDVKFSIETVDGEQFVEHDGDRLYVLNDDALLLVDKELAEEALKVRDGGDNVTTGPLAKRLGEVDQQKHAWFVAGRGGKSQPFGYTSMADADGMSGVFDLTGGDMAWSWTIDAKDASSATAIEAEVTKSVGELKSMGSVLGLPSGFESKIETERKDARVTVSMSLTKKEVEGIATALRPLLSM